MVEQNTRGLPNEMFLPVFEEVLDWQLNVVRRYPGSHITILVIEPIMEALDEIARTSALSKFRQLLSKTVRTSDLVAQGLGNEVWVLLPQSSGVNALIRWSEVFCSQNASSYRSAVVDLEHTEVLPDTAAQLMGDLRKSME